MKRPSDISWLLAQYVTRRSTWAERNIIDVQQRQDPTFEKEVSMVQQVLSRLNHVDQPPDADRDAAWERLRLHLNTVPQQSITANKPRRGLYFLAAAVVACFVLVVARVTEHPLVVVPHYETRVGQRATIDLADGSRVILGSHSKLSMSRTPQEQSSIADLRGVAQFEINTNGRQVFSVRTGSVVTRVLGTRFIVRRYPTDSTTIVGIRSGKVSVRTFQDNTTLTAGNIGYFSDSMIVALKTATANELESLTDDRLVFVNTPVTVILRELSRWYGYTFRPTDTTMFARRATITFRINDRAEVFRLLKDLLEVTIVIKDSTVILHPRPTHFKQGGDDQADFPRLRKDTPTVIAPTPDVGR